MVLAGLLSSMAGSRSDNMQMSVSSLISAANRLADYTESSDYK